MSVDSEAIFMLLDLLPTRQEVFPQLIGSYATAWFDGRETTGIHLARGLARPLVLGSGDGIVMFASTTHALAFAAGQLDLPLHMHEARTSSLMTLENGVVRDTKRIKVQRFTERPTTEYRLEGPTANAARSLAVAQAFDTSEPPAVATVDDADATSATGRSDIDRTA